MRTLLDSSTATLIRQTAKVSGKRGRMIGLLLAGLIASTPAHAYIDPGTGSVILQGLLASIAVAFGVVRAYWERIKLFFSRSEDATETTREDSGDAANVKSRS